ncbi:hypothetical protein STHERM_c19710 [Spirochaeta thermophila DSM 6192]|uniref:Uncharacterized protein n=1 Tax=Winmispira thermophila (strain ATCC 49972 / DSM 6192 / RI 19.B1) TaxID=665571 RepID=E0RQD0_WINT6|nr:hypothetical protein STHERM_c19710 [Spirochaeta thermophila DSM 6192]
MEGGRKGEVRVDEEGRLFIRGELATRDYATWFEYRTGKKILPERDTYLGKDKDGNEYWEYMGVVYAYRPKEWKPAATIFLDLSKTLGSVAWFLRKPSVPV